MKINRIIRVVIYVIAISFFTLGVIGLYFNNNKSELNGPKGIVVDQEGTIYCGLIPEGKINIYDKTGRYMRSIIVNAEGGTFKIEIENSGLKVAVSRTSKLLTYNKLGNLIKEEELKLDFYNFGQKNEKEYTDNYGNTYKIKSILWIYPYIQKTTKAGESVKVVSVPFKSWIFMKPMPAWLLMFVGIMLLSPDLYKLRKRITSNTGEE